MDLGKIILLLIDGWRNGSRQEKFHIHSYFFFLKSHIHSFNSTSS